MLNITPANPVITIGEQLTLVRHFHDIYGLCQLGYSPYLLLNSAALLRQILSHVALHHRFAAPTDKGLDVEKTIQFMLDNITSLQTQVFKFLGSNLAEDSNL